MLRESYHDKKRAGRKRWGRKGPTSRGTGGGGLPEQRAGGLCRWSWRTGRPQGAGGVLPLARVRSRVPSGGHPDPPLPDRPRLPRLPSKRPSLRSLCPARTTFFSPPHLCRAAPHLKRRLSHLLWPSAPRGLAPHLDGCSGRASDDPQHSVDSFRKKKQTSADFLGEVESQIQTRRWESPF